MTEDNIPNVSPADLPNAALEKRSNAFSEMFQVANQFLAKYRNIIGLGVFLMLLAFCIVFMYSISEQREIAESCGFTDGKLKCICTEDAWNQKMNKKLPDLVINGEVDNFGAKTQSLNTNIS